MAEFMLKDRVKKLGIAENFFISSAATSTEEIGNPVHRGTRDRLRREGISTAGKYAVQMTPKDYYNYDILLGMDNANVRNMRNLAGGDPEGKIKRLLDYTNSPRDIEDPWYTGNFEATYQDIAEGLDALLTKILEN